MTEKETVLTPQEQIGQYRKLKDDLLNEYQRLKVELEYAQDNVEAGFFKEKRDKLAGQIKMLASKIDTLQKEENPA